MTIQANDQVLPTNVRLWVYTALHGVMSHLKESSVKMDIQLILEVALDEIVSRRLLPNQTLGYDIKKTLNIWQDNARNGYSLYDILEHWVPSDERDVFKDVSHETLSACFTTALMIGREDHSKTQSAHQNHEASSQPSALPDLPLSPQRSDPPLHDKKWVVVLWPVSLIVSMLLGVYLGSGL